MGWDLNTPCERVYGFLVLLMPLGLSYFTQEEWSLQETKKINLSGTRKVVLSPRMRLILCIPGLQNPMML